MPRRPHRRRPSRPGHLHSARGGRARDCFHAARRIVARDLDRVRRWGPREQSVRSPDPREVSRLSIRMRTHSGSSEAALIAVPMASGAPVDMVQAWEVERLTDQLVVLRDSSARYSIEISPTSRPTSERTLDAVSIGVPELLPSRVARPRRLESPHLLSRFGSGRRSRAGGGSIEPGPPRQTRTSPNPEGAPTVGSDRRS